MDSTQNYEDYYDSSDEKWVLRFYGISYDLNSIHKIQLHLTIDKKIPGPGTTLYNFLPFSDFDQTYREFHFYRRRIFAE